MMLHNELRKYTIKYYEEMNEEISSDKFLSAYYDFEMGENGKFMTIDQVTKIQNTARKIVDNFLTVDGEINSSIGMLIGQVQSGKTKAFLATISAAFDSGYDAVFVLAGFDKTLKKQNTERLKSTFKSRYFSELDIDVDEIVTEDDIENQSSFLASPMMKKRGTKRIFTTLKNISWLEKLKKVVEKISDSGVKILIIDDEGDQGSLNNERRDADYYDVDEASRINGQIRKIIDSSSNISFLTVTATPYANLVARMDSDLSPNFCIETKPGIGYKGLDYFHNGDYEMIKVIENYREERENEVGYICNDINSDALPTFIVGNAYIRTINSDDQKKKFKTFEMLVHIKRGVDLNEDALLLLKNKLDEVSKHSKKEESDIDYQVYFIEEFIKKGIRSNNIEWVLDNDEIYNAIIEDVKEYIDLFKFKHLKSKEIYNPKSYHGDRLIIGAQLIERGVTFDNLRLTYMSFIAQKPQADSILQRARWFGYRDESELITVYLPKKLIEIYEQIAFAQHDLYKKIKTRHGLLDVIENGFPFPISVARNNVNLDAKHTSINNMNILQRHIWNQLSNLRSEDEMLMKMISDPKLRIEKYFDWKHAFIKVDVDYLFENYSEYLKVIYTKLNNHQELDEEIDRLHNKLKSESIQDIHIMLPHYFVERKVATKKRRVYNIDADNEKPTEDSYVALFQGKSQEEKISNDKRPNDRDVLSKYCIKKGIKYPIAQIQIHRVEYKNIQGVEHHYAMFFENVTEVKGVTK